MAGDEFAKDPPTSSSSPFSPSRVLSVSLSYLLALCLAVLAVIVFVRANYLQPQSGVIRAVLCLDAQTGEVLWNTPVFVAKSEKSHSLNSQAPPTPACDGECVYAYFGSGLAALDLTGRVLWLKRDADFAGFIRYGAGSSVALAGDRIIIYRDSEFMGHGDRYYTGLGHSAVVTAVGVDQVTPVDGTFNVTYKGSSTLPVDAGSYEVEVTFNSNDSNYASTSTIGTLTILAQTSSIGLGGGGQWEFTYNGSPQSVVGSAYGYDYSITQYVPINGTFTYEYFNEYGSNTQLFGPPLPGAPTNAGYYTFIENFTSLDPNFASGSYSWDLYIDPASPTMTINPGPLTYNGCPVSILAVTSMTRHFAVVLLRSFPKC